MDFENASLVEWWASCPTGPNRYADPAWAEFIKAQVYPHHSDVDWSEYVAWVEAGFGDDYFLEEVEPPPAQSPPDTRCSGCGRGDDFCRCGTDGIWWGR